ncbi:MAG: radical SAM protein, partial [Muribaculaceae bacterium]|nr:radical SAM protein [Muribaculaceae bacterium]
MAKDQTVLFHSTIFGPIHSRRLGVSLGVNLSPDDGKVCSFDCIYCEAGYNAQGKGSTGLPAREKVREDLERKLKAMSDNGESLDVITFSGNGEPTLHPDFPGIIDDTIALRDRFFPQAKVSVLSNSTRIFTPTVARALRKVDTIILKLHAAIRPTRRSS